MKNATFYDIHCHAMNLSHPNILAFFGRVRVERRGFRDAFFGPYSSFLLQRPITKMKNLLSVMENDMGSFFMLMEDDLAGTYLKDGREPLIRDRVLSIGGREYDRIVITPLIMDFEHPFSYDESIYYNRPASKPINEQVVDVVGGIRQYRKERPDGMLEIYPFLGVNTRHYTLKQLEALLQKYFGMYRPLNTLFRNVFAAMPNLTITLQSLGNFNFAGVKLYPPLGFDPWPEDDPSELEKVRYLYEFCEKKGIPITTHCAASGFVVIDAKTADLYTSPGRWSVPLGEYPNLKVNFAHMGRQYGGVRGGRPTEWLETIFSYIETYPNVYTDFSFIGAEPSFYEQLLELLPEPDSARTGRFLDRIMFGSDFMINLLEIESYDEYIRRFSDSVLPPEWKERFCSANPETFLFG